MRRQIITLFISLFVVLAAPQAQAENRGALFKAQAGGHTLYLFGTMHVGLPEFFPLEPRIEDAISHAAVVALEVDPQQDPAVIAQSMQRYGLQPPGTDNGLSAADRARLEKALKRTGIEASTAAVYKPWLLATLMSLSEYTVQGYRPDLSVDNYVATQARKARVPVVELESVDMQLALFNGLDAAGQRAFLVDTLDAMDSGKQAHEVREVVEAWRHADKAKLDEIAQHAQEDTTMSGRFVQQVLLDGRNGPLADKVAAQLQRTGSSVVAVGVLHLVGPKSIPALLRQKGITVERVY
ncbi:MAG: TraB/GumN family protein [Telluria sp.]